MARFHMKKFGLVLPDAKANKNYKDNWEETFGKKDVDTETQEEQTEEEESVEGK